MEQKATAAERDPLPQQSPGLRLISASGTHVGKVRRLNEDAVLARPDIGLWAVADGVGGEYAGDRASRYATEALNQLPAPETASGFLTAVCARLQEVNHLLRDEAASLGDDRLIASTIVVLLIFGRDFACTWAGDSRLYLYRGGTLRQISRDHSEVQELVDRGLLTPLEARRHPRGNVVTRALGAEDAINLEMMHDTLLPGDRFLLCSDGLDKMLQDDEIAALLADNSPEKAVGALIDLALKRGGRDNVSVIVVDAVHKEAP